MAASAPPTAIAPKVMNPTWQVVAHADQITTMAFTGRLEEESLSLWHGVIRSIAGIRPGPVIIDMSHLMCEKIQQGAVIIQILPYAAMQGRRFIWCGTPPGQERCDTSGITELASRFGVCWEFEPDVATALTAVGRPSTRRPRFPAR